MVQARALVVSEASRQIEQIKSDVAGQLMPSSQRIYRMDINAFLEWLRQRKLTIPTMSRSDAIAYREYLQASCAKRTAMRRFAVMRRFLEEAVFHGLLPANPAERVRGFKMVSGQETPHTALELAQLKELLALVNQNKLVGKRDYALLLIMGRMGLRRDEVAQLTVADLQMKSGHHVLVVRHGKGDKYREVKMPVDVFRAIEMYRTALTEALVRDELMLFVTHWHGGVVRGQLDGKSIERMVAKYGLKMEPPMKLTPHDLRATFITLALEGGAKLQDVQYTVGHADPRTTEHYQKRKLNLDNSAVDYIML